jgi:uncharacterized protein (TIGR02118 family)
MNHASKVESRRAAASADSAVTDPFAMSRVSACGGRVCWSLGRTGRCAWLSCGGPDAESSGEPASVRHRSTSVIKVSVFYPNSADTTFDMDYYVNTHMPFVEDRCGPAIKGVSVDEGVAGGAPGEGAPYAAIGHLLFDSVEDFQGAFGPHADEIMGDIPNFTRIRPVVQISEIKL